MDEMKTRDKPTAEEIKNFVDAFGDHPSFERCIADFMNVFENTDRAEAIMYMTVEMPKAQALVQAAQPGKLNVVLNGEDVILFKT